MAAAGIKPESQVSGIMISAKPPVHTYLFFENGDFFSPVWPTVHTFPVKTVIENAPQSGNCWKRRLIVFVGTDKSGGFFNMVMSYIKQRMPYVRLRSYSHRLACSYERAKTIGIR